MLKKYDDIISEQKRHGIIEEVVEPGEIGETHYLPHHQVIREDNQNN